MAGMMVQKRRREEKGRSSNDMVRNRFPSRSVRRGKQEGVKDTLVEYSPSIEAGSMAGLMLKREEN
jgi:hypothetical protein